jgi:exopolysaccharide biosynthesis WecB/TagA/CpsF family protein
MINDLALKGEDGWICEQQLPAIRSFVDIYGLKIETLTVSETATFYVDYCLQERRLEKSRPLFLTSVNGQVISLCARNETVRKCFERADMISPDGQPMVFLSQMLARSPFPERVATTDLYPEVARLAAEAGLSFYLLGSTETVNRRAAEMTQRDFPSLQIAGWRNGYFRREEEAEICAEIALAKPDILWVGLGAPHEQEFCLRNLNALRGVGIIKTAGGLFDFVSGERRRSPKWLQDAGLEWLFRLALEPQRLLVRYAVSSPHALLLMLKSLR